MCLSENNSGPKKKNAINQQLSFEITSPQFNSNSRMKVCSQSLIKTTYMYMHVATKLSVRYVELLFLCVGRLRPRVLLKGHLHLNRTCSRNSVPGLAWVSNDCMVH